MSEEQLEIETANVDERGGEPPKKTSGGTVLSSGGGRGGKQRATAPSFFTRTAQFIRDTRGEMRRVSWPTATEVKNTTIITLVAVVFFALYLFGIDKFWAFLIGNLRGWLGG